jgi:hypothetical protein
VLAMMIRLPEAFRNTKFPYLLPLSKRLEAMS